MITLDFYYKLLREATVSHPKSTVNCLFPQTFAVINHIGDLNLPNLGKTVNDHKEGYFYSRAWKASNYNANNIVWAYPLVAVQNYSFEVHEFLGRPIVYQNLTLGVYDVLESPCSSGLDCQRCKSRSVNKIETDTEYILFNILKYVKNIEYAVVRGERGLYSSYFLDYLETTVDSKPTGRVKHSPIYKTSEAFYGVRVDTTVDKIFGTEISLKVATGFCETTDFDFVDTIPLRGLTECCK